MCNNEAFGLGCWNRPFRPKTLAYLFTDRLILAGLPRVSVAIRVATGRGEKVRGPARIGLAIGWTRFGVIGFAIGCTRFGVGWIGLAAG
jgi:hypothetical protein